MMLVCLCFVFLQSVGMLALFGADVLERALMRLIERYLVDPASSHMLCSRIKPCMSKYEHVLYCETADSSLYQL